MASTDTIRIDFICVQNAGRSQMAAAFAELERDERGLEDIVEIHSAGTDPADKIHGNVVDAMAEVGIDLSDRSPSWVVPDDLKDSHYLVTIGRTITEFNPVQYGVETCAFQNEKQERSQECSFCLSSRLSTRYLNAGCPSTNT